MIEHNTNVEKNERNSVDFETAISHTGNIILLYQIVYAKYFVYDSLKKLILTAKIEILI